MLLPKLLLPVLLAGPLLASAQLMQPRPAFTRADSLRGGQRPERTCYDIRYYHLDVKLNIPGRAISGSNQFVFTATRDFTRLQFDLFANLAVQKVTWHGRELPFTREFNAVFVTFPEPIKQGARDEFTVTYAGQPTVAKKAPWDGGFVFSQDAKGQPWVATANQGVGASIWWPNKDQQADEVDSMLISVAVPKGLKDVSNGRLRATKPLPGGYTRYDWAVRNPINNYDVALNVGNYVHFADVYQGESGPLTLDYWVLPENLEKAKVQFGANVKPMLKSMEYWFGPYPWYQDGYKLVEAPHLGMEHQSAVAYGNHYQNGYLGRDLSGTGWGSKWDFIIIHESGHEWFGNSITSKDIADMWVHEGFTSYSEGLFVESQYGKQAGQEYQHGLRRSIQNDSPIVGPYGVNREGSGDMYTKGSTLLNMVRTIVNDDAKWRQMLRGLNQKYFHQTITGQQVIDYFSQQSGQGLQPLFDQYLHYTAIPVLELRIQDGQLQGRWVSNVTPDVQEAISTRVKAGTPSDGSFQVPVRIRLKGGEWKFVTPGMRFKPLDLPGATRDNVEVDTFNYYIGVLMD